MRPYRQHSGDAGADLEVPIPYIIYPHETILVKTGYTPQMFDIPGMLSALSLPARRSTRRA